MRRSNPAPSAYSLALSRCTSATLLATIAALMIWTGCTTALRITHKPAGPGNPASVPGMPFYVKKARCRQEVVWFEPIYTLTLSALVPDKDGTPQSHPRGALSLSRTNFNKTEVTDFIKLLNSGPTDEATVLRSWSKVVGLVQSQVLALDFASVAPDDRILVGRSAAPAVYVDYTDQYYINAKVPISGSASVNPKLAEDGTLSEVSGQVENKTLETILSALPISSLITGGLGLPAKGVPPPPGTVEAFQLTVTISGYRHTLARLIDYPVDGGPCPVALDIALTAATEYKREDMTAANSDSAKSDKGTDSKTKKTDTTEKNPDGKNSPSGDQKTGKDSGTDSKSGDGSGSKDKNKKPKKP